MSSPGTSAFHSLRSCHCHQKHNSAPCEWGELSWVHSLSFFFFFFTSLRFWSNSWGTGTWSKHPYWYAGGLSEQSISWGRSQSVTEQKPRKCFVPRAAVSKVQIILKSRWSFFSELFDCCPMNGLWNTNGDTEHFAFQQVILHVLLILKNACYKIGNNAVETSAPLTERI